MNRIILIGNGFDLAHNLPTKYEDFIKWYWEQRIIGFRNNSTPSDDDGICAYRPKNNLRVCDVYGCSEFANYSPSKDNLFFEQLMRFPDMCFSPMFKRICYSIQSKGWVDIEDSYYSLLISNDPAIPVANINNTLEILKSKLIVYLDNIQKTSIFKLDPEIRFQILEPIHKREIANESLQSWYDMIEERLDYSDDDWDELLEGYNVNPLNPQYSVDLVNRVKKNIIADKKERDIKLITDEDYSRVFFLPDNIMILDFNYTNTSDQYLPKSNHFSINHIHGNLSEPSSIIFGYGDEIDDEFKKLVNKNDSDYLRHIKSFRYLESLNYRKMLSFVESAPYQLCIMGHSCGTSDRTLLSTLFEHKNCVSIKPYYYCKDNGTDNYIDLVQNISRSFNNPRIMRDRVVSKPLCEELGKRKK